MHPRFISLTTTDSSVYNIQCWIDLVFFVHWSHWSTIYMIHENSFGIPWCPSKTESFVYRLGHNVAKHFQYIMKLKIELNISKCEKSGHSMGKTIIQFRPFIVLTRKLLNLQRLASQLKYLHMGIPESGYSLLVKRLILMIWKCYQMVSVKCC